MLEKKRKQYVLVIGSNEEGITESRLDEQAMELEKLGNSKLLPSCKVHIFAKAEIN